MAVQDLPSLKMRKWSVRVLEFTPLALIFILALTPTLVPSTRAQRNKRSEKDCLEDQPCTPPGFYVEFKMEEVRDCNKMVNLTVTEDQPDLKVEDNSEIQEGTEVLILMVDPDAPTEKSCVYYLHWMALATLQGRKFNDGLSIVAYTKPSPPKDTVHRYQLLLFPEPDSTPGELTVTGGPNFDLRKFKKDYGLNESLASFQFRTGTP